MADKIYKDFLGLNICIYDPCGPDSGSFDNIYVQKDYFDNNGPIYWPSTNTMGYRTINAGSEWGSDPFKTNFYYTNSVGYGNVGPLTKTPNANVLVLLNLHRNGPYGYGSWKQIRASHNHLIRYQKRNNIVTHVRSPGSSYQTQIGSQTVNRADRYGPISSSIEPVVASSYKPLQFVGDMTVYNPNINGNQVRAVSVSTAFSNETCFFADEKFNHQVGTVMETDVSYEDLKGLYLNDALNRSSSPFQSFRMLLYKQTVFPKMSRSFLNKTRSRMFYKTFWRNSRTNRQETNIPNRFATNQPTIPTQSIWPLDASEDFTTRTLPSLFDITGGYANIPGGGASRSDTIRGQGVLWNSYAQFGGNLGIGATSAGPFNYPKNDYKDIEINQFMTASVVYARRHTLRNINSVVAPSGMAIYETGSAYLQDYGATFPMSMYSGTVFAGEAAWDAGKQSGKNPWYDSYSDYSADIRLKGADYSILPEFRISSHVKTYQSLGVTEELEDIFELSGALDKNTTSSDIILDDLDPYKRKNFYSILSNTDFLKHFDLIKKDHQDFVKPTVLKLKCKVVKKFLPYEGFYPVQRTIQMAKQFYESYASNTEFYNTYTREDPAAAQCLLQPLFAPGILYNTIKAGVACDWPMINRDDLNSENATKGSGMTFVNDFGQAIYNQAYSKWGGYGGVSLMPWKQYSFMNCMSTGSLKNASVTWTAGSPSNLYGDLWTTFSQRVPFEAMVQPEEYLRDVALRSQEIHPWSYGGTGSIWAQWNGQGDSLFTKMSSNFLAMVPEFFLKGKNFSTIASAKSEDPNFGNAISGNYYMMRVKMYRSTDRPSTYLRGYGNWQTWAPQDLVSGSWSGNRSGPRETFTMYSRPSAFGPPLWGSAGTGSWGDALQGGSAGNYTSSVQPTSRVIGNDSLWGYNWAYTPPYYHGEAWCDLVFNCTASKKYTVEEIIGKAKEWPYQTRHWWNGTMNALRDLTGYQDITSPKNRPPGAKGVTYPGLVSDRFGDIRGPYESYVYSPWSNLINSSQFGRIFAYYSAYNYQALPPGPSSGGKPSWPQLATLDYNVPYFNWGDNRMTDGYTFNSGAWAGPPIWSNTGSYPYHPYYVNSNAMQLESSVNLFGVGAAREIKVGSSTTGQDETVLVAESAGTSRTSRWIIQPKFETPMMNFNKYKKLSDECTEPRYGQPVVPRGMWHQYGEIEEDPSKGVFLQVTDIPKNWLKGALGLNSGTQERYVKSLASLCGFDQQPVKLGNLAITQKLWEAVVAVPFVEKEGKRKFFTIPRKEIDDVAAALNREIEPNVFVAGGPPKTGASVVQMVRNMKKYVFPPPMDFVKYPEIQPFAMYIFEFSANLTRKDVGDIWQNLPPSIGTGFEESEVSISHELLAKELMGGGAVMRDGELVPNAPGNGIDSEIRWMLFKVKQRAKTNYFDKVVQQKGTTEDTSNITVEGLESSTVGQDPSITYNWPYDFFSLVELVKLDSEVTFANIETTSENQRDIVPIKKLSPEELAERDQSITDQETALGITKEEE